MSKLDPSFLESLELPLDPSTISITSHGSSGFSSTYKVTGKILPCGRSLRRDSGHGGHGFEEGKGDNINTIKSATTESTISYFMKICTGSSAEIMLRGEYYSLKAISDVVPSLCPKPHGFGVLSGGRYFLLTDFLELGRSYGFSFSQADEKSLAVKLAKLHTQEYVREEEQREEKNRRFGFPFETCCGNTVQDNTWETSWSEFFIKRRLLKILDQCEKNNGSDMELRDMIERKMVHVAQRLLGDEEGCGRNVKPVAVHGDLWSGNKGIGRLKRWDDNQGKMTVEEGELVFDPSSCYGHSEYDLGIMSMFGGFSREFYKEYHRRVPKTEPVEEHDDRVKLYELYHHLNHYTIFGHGYRSGAMSIMHSLARKYCNN